MDSTDWSRGGDPTEVEPYGPPRLTTTCCTRSAIWWNGCVGTSSISVGSVGTTKHAPSCRSSSSRPATYDSSECRQSLERDIHGGLVAKSCSRRVRQARGATREQPVLLDDEHIQQSPAARQQGGPRVRHGIGMWTTAWAAPPSVNRARTQASSRSVLVHRPVAFAQSVWAPRGAGAR
jgi:hypothetical protein